MILCINIGWEKKMYSTITFTTLDLRTLETSLLTPTNGNTSFICCFLLYYMLTRLTVSVV